MPANLYPLIYKPGIKRDGTLFQSEYCTNGQWVRFRRGMVQKIGGQLGMNIDFNTRINTLLMASSGGGPNCYAFVGTNNQITKLAFNPAFIVAQAPAFIIPQINNMPDLLWQFEIITRSIIQGNQTIYEKRIVCFGANNGRNITQNSAPIMYEGLVEPDVFNTQLTLVNINPLANGGICFAPPYLFIYGSNGYVSYSTSADPFVFTGGDSGQFKIPGGKVIYGRQIRGGTSSPSLLFWTMSAVVRVTNVGDQGVLFKNDVLSTSTSILSSKCVVEYDGLFFWPGTDRFFVFNGVVQEMDNKINQQYFFDNLDMSQRQKVFGVRNPKYGEIWWYYPEKGQTEVSHAIVYNIKENTWYDTTISRNAGTYFEEEGLACTAGAALLFSDNRNYLWQHEVEIDQVWYPNFLGGERTTAAIFSSFVTPTFSWAAFNPMKQLTGNDRWVDLKRIEPDFVMNDNTDAMSVVVHTKEYAQSTDTISAPFQFTGATEKLDMSVQGRHMSLEFTSNKYFEMGHVMLQLGIGDSQ